MGFWLPLVGQILYLISVFVSKIDYFTVFNPANLNYPPEMVTALISNLLVFTLLIVSIVFLFRKSDSETRYLLLLIIIPAMLLFYVLDLVRNGITSWWWRYLIFIAPGIFLIMTHLLYKKIEKGKLIYALIYLGLIFFGFSSILTISKSRHWHMGFPQEIYIKDAAFISRAAKPLLITDFSYNIGMIDFMVVMKECTSENIDILRASPNIKNIDEKLGDSIYSDIYVFHSSDQLIENLKTQFEDRMDSLEFEGISTIWQINNYE